MAAIFPSVRAEGGLLPPDLLQRISEGDPEIGGFGATDYGLGGRDTIRDAIARDWRRVRAYWAAFVAATDGLPEAATGVTETREQWVLPLLRALGYQPDFQAAAEEIGGRRYAISHRDDPVPIHVVSFKQDLDRASGAEGGSRAAPHALVQEYLNRGERSLYGLVSNGHILRLLRDNVSLTRLSYVEFDLKAMIEGGVYADFVLLWLTLHRSRLPARDGEATSCWLEAWRDRAETQGTRAMGALRQGVEQAIVALGTGFLAHATNEAIRGRLRSGELATQAFYAQLLRLLYRLLFLFVVEERDLLFPAEATPAERQRYAGHYSANRLRTIVRRHLEDERHDDLWRSLTLVFAVLAGRRAGLGLPGLGGGLFDAEACPDLDGSALLSNAALCQAIGHLSTVQVEKRWRRVNYRDMDVEELGGVYESLLDRQPRVVVDAENPHFELVGSGERKQTGSYYTPAPLVNELVKSALDPVIADRLSRARTAAERERALLGITVCDAAAGSGHFLLAAARRIADELARVRSADQEPTPVELRHALRDVVRHCIYAVDANPLAVDLCKLTLWLEGHEAGRPLGFLDHRVKLGNSLVGATHELLAEGIPDGAYDAVTGDAKSIATETKRRNRQERAGQRGFGSVDTAWADLREDLAVESLEIAELDDAVLGRVAEQRERYEAFRERAVDPAREPLDLWTAAFFWPLADGEPPAPTTEDLRRALAGGVTRLSPNQRRALDRLRDSGHTSTGSSSSRRCLPTAASTACWATHRGTRLRCTSRSSSPSEIRR